MTALGTATLRPAPPYGIHPDRDASRGPLGRFRPNEIRDPLGRKLIVLDLREVERRLKARPRREEE